MRILALDTASRACSAAVWQEGSILAAETLQNGNMHAVALMPMLERLLSLAGISVNETDCIAVAVGPGSFTGLRIGISTAKGLSLPGSIAVAPVGTLAAAAHPFLRAGCLTVPILDARRGQVYGAVYAGAKEIYPAGAVPLSDLLAFLRKDGRPALFCGDGVFAYQGTLKEAGFAHAPLSACAGYAPAIAEIAAAQKECWVLGEALSADYKRLSQAEREYESNL